MAAAAVYCKLHRPPGWVDVRNRRCDLCHRRATWGEQRQPRRHTDMNAAHGRRGAVELMEPAVRGKGGAGTKVSKAAVRHTLLVKEAGPEREDVGVATLEAKVGGQGQNEGARPGCRQQGSSKGAGLQVHVGVLERGPGPDVGVGRAAGKATRFANSGVLGPRRCRLHRLPHHVNLYCRKYEPSNVPSPRRAAETCNSATEQRGLGIEVVLSPSPVAPPLLAAQRQIAPSAAASGPLLGVPLLRRKRSSSA